MDLIKMLTEAGLEVPEELLSKLKGSWVSEQEMTRKVQKAEADRDNYKSQLDTATETLKGFEGKDFDAMTKEIEDWKAKATQAEADYKADLAKRDYQDAISKLVEDVKFSSNSAKKAFVQDLTTNPLQLRDGKVLGFDDYLKSAKESDPDAFISAEQGEKAKFTEGIENKGGSNNPNGIDFFKIMGVSKE